MSFHEHNRLVVISAAQHPYRHNLSEFLYSHPLLPNVKTVEEAIGYFVGFMYPQSIGSFPTMADLLNDVPAPNLNDYAYIEDDGDGKGAGYVYQRIDGISAWHKRYDVDWSMETILAEFGNRTQYQYVHKYGFTDKDAAGDPITGDFEGQSIYGGDQENQHLTLHANSADTLGTITGFIQVNASIRPTVDAEYSLGTSTKQFTDLFLSSGASIGSLILGSGSIVDVDGEIDFDDTDLTTIGTITGGEGSFDTLSVTTSADIADISISEGEIIASGGLIDFSDTDLTTTGGIEAGSLQVDSDIIIQAGSIESLNGLIDFGDNDLTTTGELSAGLITATEIDVGDLNIQGSTISHLAGDITIQALATTPGKINLGAGRVDISNELNVAGATILNSWAEIDTIRIQNNTIRSVVSTNLKIAGKDAGLIEFQSSIVPTADDSLSIGESALKFKDLFLSGEIGDGTDSVSISDLLQLRVNPYRDIAKTIPAETGDTLFYDAINKVWLADHPDSEITHDELSGLTDSDAGHTQFVMLGGRDAGQTVHGGTDDSENLILASTTSETRGYIITEDPFIPLVDNAIDLGTSSFSFKDVYTKGEFKGLRLENSLEASIPAASAGNIGRLVYTTDTKKVLIDVGGTWITAGAGRFIGDFSLDGNETDKEITVSASIVDARNAIWQLCDKSSFERIFCAIQAISASKVKIATEVPLPAGDYRLIGLE